MKQELRKYTVSIFNEKYTLVGDESEHDVLEASRRVDALMKDIGSQAPHCTQHQKAVLAALKLALQLLSLESEQKLTLQTVKKCIEVLDNSLS